MSRILFAILTVIGASGCVVEPAAARAQTHVVELRSNFYFPGNLHISPGDSIVFKAVEHGHTVSADDRRFSWPPGNRTMNAGDSFTFVFPLEETVRFFCRVHGQAGGQVPGEYNMVGSIVVGRGAPTGSGSPQTRDVPSQYPSVQAALTGITPGSTIRVAPGEYAEPVEAPNWAQNEPPVRQASVTISTPGITIAGTGATPSDTVFDGLGQMPVGVDVAADNVTLKNLTIRNYTQEGVAARSVRGFLADRVHTRQTGAAGFVLSDVTRTQVLSSSASAASLAGIHIKGCSQCRVDKTTVSANLFGVLADNVDWLWVEYSTAVNNGTGIAVRSVAQDRQVFSRTISISWNIVSSSGVPIAGAGALDFSVASGIWLAGAGGVSVRGNQISGGDYGVVVASFGAPTVQASIESNTIDDARRAGIGFDGVGAMVCVGGNTQTGGDPATTLPATAPVIYDCNLAATVGVPEPEVLKDFLSYATGL